MYINSFPALFYIWHFLRCLGLIFLTLASKKIGLYSELAIRFLLKSVGRNRYLQDSYLIQRAINFQGRVGK